MERHDSPFIEVKLPQNIVDNEEKYQDVLSGIRNAMREIGYVYYNNDNGKIFRYAPMMPPVEYHFVNEVRNALREELSRGEVRAMINSELDDYTKNAKLKKAVKNIAADVLEEFLDSLWKRRSFWKGTINRN